MQDDATGDKLKPHHVALCILLRAQPEDTSDRRLLYTLLDLISDHSELWCPSLDTFLNQLRRRLGGDGLAEWAQAVVWDQLQGMRCPDDLLSFFAELTDIVRSASTSAAPQPPEAMAAAAQAGSKSCGFDPNSTLGKFLRRCSLAFHELPFEGVCRLLGELRGYLAEGEQLPAGEHRAEEPDLAHTGSQTPQAPATLEGILEDQLAASNRRTDAPAAAAHCATAVHHIRRGAPDLARAILLAHTQAVQRQDVTEAISTLHHYFDLAGAKATKSGSAGRHQSALLSLGAAHARFGHVQEALLALEEAIHVAQAAGDDVALAHALAALTALVEGASSGFSLYGGGEGPSAGLGEVPQGMAIAAGPHLKHIHLQHLLQRCLQPAEELQLPHLAAYARLALAKFGLQYHPSAAGPADGRPAQDTSTGVLPPSAEVGAAARDVAALHLAAALAAAVPVPLVPPAGPPPGGNANAPRPVVADLYNSSAPVFNPGSSDSQAASAAAVGQAAGAAHLLAAAAAERRGAPGLAHTATLAHLACHAGTAPADERALAFAQAASLAADRRGYRAAEQVLALADAQLPNSQSRALAAARLGMGHARALARGDIGAAMRLGACLSALPPPGDATLLNIRVEAETRNVQTLARAGSLEQAASAACDLFSTCVEAGLQAEAVRLLLVLTEVHTLARQPNLALPYALSAWLQATELHLDVLAAEASAAVAALSASFGPEACREACCALQQDLPLVLGTAPNQAQARVQLDLARALLSCASEAELQDAPDRVLRPLGAAAAAFEEVEDWARAAEAYHLSALVCHSVHLLPQRNSAASAWQRMCVCAQAAA